MSLQKARSNAIDELDKQVSTLTAENERLQKENLNQSQSIAQLQVVLDNEKIVTQRLQAEVQRQGENNEKLVNRMVATGADLKALKKHFLLGNNESDESSMQVIRKIELERNAWVKKEEEYKRINKQLRDDLTHLQHSRDFQLVEMPGYVKTIQIKAIEALKVQLNAVVEEAKLFREFTLREKHFLVIQLAAATANGRNEKRKSHLYRQEVKYLKFLCKKSFAELAAVLSKGFGVASPIVGNSKNTTAIGFNDLSEIPSANRSNVFLTI